MEWKIKKRLPHCSACQKEFEDKQEYFSALYEDESVDYLRFDYCTECWPDKGQPGYFSFWKGMFSNDPQKKNNYFNIETVYEIFEPLYENTYEPMQVPERRDKLIYILALMLMRKRILTLRSTKEKDGRSVLILNKSREEKSFEVPVPQITEAEISLLRDDISTLLGYETERE